MAKEVTAEFKTLLTKEEYERLVEHFGNKQGDLQTNYYFDTKRFTLKASDAILRVKERQTMTIALERNKGYALQKTKADFSKELLEQFKAEGVCPVESLKNELEDIIKDQKLNNFMTLSTYRISLLYKNGKLCLDKCTYCGTEDYELEYEASSHDKGKLEFIEIIKELGITYKKSQLKLKRAYSALKRTL